MSSLTVSTINALNPTAGVAIPQFVPATQFSHRNKIMNGKMDISERGGSFPAIANGVYSLDRWQFGNSSSAVVTISQQQDRPPNNEFFHSLRLTVTTADASIAAGDVAILGQPIEGYNIRDLIGRTFTLSFWVRSSKTGTHCVALKNQDTSDRSYIGEYIVNVANTWEYKVITVNGGLPTAGTWNYINGLGLQVRFALAVGSNQQTTAGAWQTGNFLATSNQVNCLDTIGNIFAITGVQLEPGSVATPFEHRPIGAELALCRRYALKLGGATANISIVAFGTGANTTSATLFYYPQTSFRATPSLASWDSLVIDDTNGQILISALTLDTTGSNPDLIRLNATATGLSQFRPYFLRSNTSAGNLILSAEL